MKLKIADFEAFHAAVHGGAPPFAWQTRLLDQIVEERAWPGVLDLPTGSGKTTCIDIALFALALDSEEPPRRWCPRRIAMVVDRRIVVDQVAERGRKLLGALVSEDAPKVVVEVAARLRSLSRKKEEPLGVFTLRGGMPKDDGWARTPDQALVLASTVDQLGSRLLIQGYGVRPGMKPVHAGLLGNDLLLLLDEVHLSQPFAETLDQLDRLRQKFARDSKLSPRFHHAFLSATPTQTQKKVFELSAEEKSAKSPLSTRLKAKKPARLLEVTGRPELQLACVTEARKLIERHNVIAVVVNRVASATIISKNLKEALGDSADVILLTGRMRPLDRDDLLSQLRPRVQTGRERAGAMGKLVLVGTQCIEAGADFDFDALVTECASLDALRQRFGRVDRLGLYGKAEAVIVRDRSAKEDPVYGSSLADTGAWIKDSLKGKEKQLDFGILALALPEEGKELEKLLAPRKHAPTLLPAYLDLWMQTAPAPAEVPDLGLWLHGPRSGPAEVQVVWRADLTEAIFAPGPDSASTEAVIDRATEIVGAVRPSSLEAMSLPFSAVRSWLSVADVGDISDVEGASFVEDSEAAQGRVALRWDGDESAIISAAQLRPGDTIVLPAERGGIRDGCFDPESKGPVDDIAERATLFGRGLPVLRLHPVILRQHGFALPSDDLAEARDALRTLAEQTDSHSWRRAWLMALANSRASITVDGTDQPWIVIEGKRLSTAKLRGIVRAEDTLEDGSEMTTDDEDSFHAVRKVRLGEHSSDVEQFARGYALALGLSDAIANDLALAAWLHDIGKADRRFQLMLRGGSEIDYLKDETPWAKSGMPPGAKGAHRIARQRSGYPKGARHEVQSVAMIDQQIEAVRRKANDLDLVLHLVASHHGHCRPFAPAIDDPNPVQVELRSHQSATFGSIDFGPVSSRNELHRLDAPLADRFWRLAAKFGWQELCWLEAILRLADHRASEEEQAVEVGS